MLSFRNALAPTHGNPDTSLDGFHLSPICAKLSKYSMIHKIRPLLGRMGRNEQVERSYDSVANGNSRLPGATVRLHRWLFHDLSGVVCVTVESSLGAASWNSQRTVSDNGWHGRCEGSCSCHSGLSHLLPALPSPWHGYFQDHLTEPVELLLKLEQDQQLEQCSSMASGR